MVPHAFQMSCAGLRIWCDAAVELHHVCSDIDHVTAADSPACCLTMLLDLAALQALVLSDDNNVLTGDYEEGEEPLAAGAQAGSTGEEAAS